MLVNIKINGKDYQADSSLTISSEIALMFMLDCFCGIPKLCRVKGLKKIINSAF